MATQVPRCRMPDHVWPETFLYKGPGTALVIGANTGYADGHPDPSFGALVSRAADHLDKVFVEPMPPLFRKLVRNLAGVPRARAVRAAVVWPRRLNESAMASADIGPDSADGNESDSEEGTRTMFCVGMEDDRGDSGEGGEDAGPTLTPAALAAGGSSLWLQTCSLDRARLFSKYDMASNGEVPAHLVTQTQVPQMTVNTLLREYVTSPVRFVQIDVEGYDDYVLRQLPLGSERFQPMLIIFEFRLITVSRLLDTLNYLGHFGFGLCIMQDNMNIAAVNVTKFLGFAAAF